MTQPLVVAVMLVNGRAEMVKRAIASFRAQTYQPKRLVVWDTGANPALELRDIENMWYERESGGQTIGRLRNAANVIAKRNMLGDIIAHWDSDDYSHPRRMEEQVALLQASGKECVGYRELLFWDTRYPGAILPTGMCARGEGWLYTNHQPNWAAGASLLYTRSLWERQPFDDAPHEDQRWMMTPAVSAQCLGVSSLVAPRLEDNDMWDAYCAMPRMVCSIHGGNTEQIDPTKLAKKPGGTLHWKRAPEWDAYCAEHMQL